MTLEELIGAFRTEADDATEPYLWSDEEIVAYLNDAENESCIRAGLLHDEKTSSLAVLAIQPGTAQIELSPLVLDVLTARLTSNGLPLFRDAPEAFLSHAAQPGRPHRYCVDRTWLRLHPVPDQAETLTLRVSRLPLAPLTLQQPNATPEIPVSEQARLLGWALFRAFSKRDADSYDKGKAMEFAAQFSEHFGPRPSAHARRQFKDAAQHRVRFRGF